MGFGNVYISLALAKQQLSTLGITQPTPQQLQAALTGGTITQTTGTGATATTTQVSRTSSGATYTTTITRSPGGYQPMGAGGYRPMGH